MAIGPVGQSGRPPNEGEDWSFYPSPLSHLPLVAVAGLLKVGAGGLFLGTGGLGEKRESP